MSYVLNNIYNNVSFALNLNTEAIARLQEQASTGAKINRASDGPSAAYQILGLNSQERDLENYIDNLSDVVSTLGLSSSIIENITSAITRAKTDLTQIISGIYDDEARKRTAESINNTLEHIVSLANTKHMNQHIFGGSDTTSAPYVVTRTNGQITSVTYQGSDQERNIEVAPGLNSSAFCIGDDIFRSNDRSVPTFLGNTGAKAGTGTSSVRGDVWLTVTGSPGNYSLSIDGGLTTFNTNGTDTNLAVTDSVTGRVLYVDCTEIATTGDDMVRTPGTYDVFSTLISIRNILKNEKGLSEARVQSAVGGANSSFNPLDEVNYLLVQTQVSIGSKIGFLDDLKENLKNQKYNAEDDVTRLQEADIAQIAIDLSRRNVLYQMSLSVAAKLMSMSLLDFLR